MRFFLCLSMALLFIMLDTPPVRPVPPTLLDWPTVNKQMPWSVIILLGGGFALAEACKVSRIRFAVVP